jgi:hypothetical protein
MKYTGKDSFDDLLKFSEDLNGCYCEYKFSKELHEFLLTKTKTWAFDKKQNLREYWLDRNYESVYWRIFLR